MINISQYYSSYPNKIEKYKGKILKKEECNQCIIGKLNKHIYLFMFKWNSNRYSKIKYNQLIKYELSLFRKKTGYENFLNKKDIYNLSLNCVLIYNLYMLNNKKLQYI